MNFPEPKEKNYIRFKDSSDWVLLCEETDEFQAQIIRGKLMSENIESQMMNYIDSAKFMTIGKNAIIKIYVKVEEHSKAKDILMSEFEDFDDIEINNS